MLTKEKTMERAISSNINILDDPNVAPYLGERNEYGETPVHRLAWVGRVEVLDHPKAVPYLGVQNEDGDTPIHILAWVGSFNPRTRVGCDRK